MIVAAAQPALQSLDVNTNAAAHAATIQQAGARLVVFPELSLTGYELDAPHVTLDDPVWQPIVDACIATDTVALVGAPVEATLACVRIDADGPQVAYRKTFLGGRETEIFTPGDGPGLITLDGLRIGIGICKDTGVDEHVQAVAELNVDLYVAGVVHHRSELDVQDARGPRIAQACDAHVAFASYAGPTGEGYTDTAGASTIWAPDGAELARAGASPGEIAKADVS